MKLTVRLQTIRRFDNAGRAVQRQTDLPAPLRQTKAGRQNVIGSPRQCGSAVPADKLQEIIAWIKGQQAEGLRV